jgi:RimJ/RimL family protein N-acetyltransferase
MSIISEPASEFTGKKVYLRGVEEGDLILRPKWFNDSEINRTLLIDYPVSLATTQAWFRRILPEQHRTRIDLSICDKLSNKVIGMSGLININHRHQHAQFYMTIGEKEFWRQHIPAEVIPMVLGYAFNTLNLNKVYLWTIKTNDNARSVYERNGFIQEALMRQHFYCRGGLQDIYQHRILREDWLKTT